MNIYIFKQAEERNQAGNRLTQVPHKWPTMACTCVRVKPEPSSREDEKCSFCRRKSEAVRTHVQCIRRLRTRQQLFSMTTSGADCCYRNDALDTDCCMPWYHSVGCT